MKNEILSCPLNTGKTPPSTPLKSKNIGGVKLSKCKNCDKLHGFCVENMETGEMKPLPLCYECFWDNISDRARESENV